MSTTSHQGRLEPSPAMQRLAEIRSAPGYRPDLPTLDRPGVVMLCSSMGVEVSERGVKFESIRGGLASHKVLGRNRWAEADVIAWLLGTRRVGTSHTDKVQ